MSAQLTPGAVVAISEHADGNGALKPMLQVVDVRMVSNANNPSTERFRMVLSDGIYTMQSMLPAARTPVSWTAPSGRAQLSTSRSSPATPSRTAGED